METNYSTSQCKTLSPQELAKQEMKKVNQYDYNKMLEEFKFQDSLAKIKKKKIYKIKTDNAMYKESIRKMRLKTQEAEVNRINSIRQSLDEKRAGVEANKSRNSKEKNEKLLQSKNERSKMEQTAKSNVENHLASIEVKRIEEADRTMQKLKYFQEKYKEISQERQKSYSTKLNENVQKYNQHYLIQIKEEKKLTQTREEEKLKKYTDNYWKQKERMTQIKKKKEKHMEHLNKVKEIKEEKENDLRRKKNRIIQKIEKMSKKRQSLEEERQKKLEQALINEENKKIEINERLQRIKRNENEFRNAVLLYQQDMIWRGLDKDNAVSLKKSNAHEATVLSQIELERSFPKFILEMNALKNESISKKSMLQKKQIYKELQQAEEERKKKEREDKLLKQF